MKFNFDPPFTYICVGNSGSGKTTLVMDLLEKIFIPIFKQNIFIMSPTMEYSGDFLEYRSKIEKKNKDNGAEYFYYSWEPDIIQEIIEQQKENIKKYGKERTPQVCIILDDVMEVLHNSPLIDMLFFKARHYKISTIALFQKLNGLSRVCRINTKYLTFFRTANESELQNIWDEYFSKSQKKKLEPIILSWFENPWSFIHLDLKTQQFSRRIALGKDKTLIEFVN